ncbi:hypothetical protein ACVR1G_02735 [Streptococcus dentasini]
MANLLNYLDVIKNQSLDNYSLNEIDCLVLTELGYLPFNGLLTKIFDLGKSLSLAQLGRIYFQKYGDKPFSSTACKNRIKLLKKS